MPQLDTVYLFTIFMWTWFTLYLTTQKIKTFLMTNPTTQLPPNKPSHTLPWL